MCRTLCSSELLCQNRVLGSRAMPACDNDDNDDDDDDDNSSSSNNNNNNNSKLMVLMAKVYNR